MYLLLIFAVNWPLQSIKQLAPGVVVSTFGVNEHVVGVVFVFTGVQNCQVTGLPPPHPEGEEETTVRD